MAGQLVPRDRNKTLTALARLEPGREPPRLLQALISSVAAGCGLHLYIRT